MSDFDGSGQPRWLTDPFGKPKPRPNKYKERIATLEATNARLMAVVEAAEDLHADHEPRCAAVYFEWKGECDCSLKRFRDALAAVEGER